MIGIKAISAIHFALLFLSLSLFVAVPSFGGAEPAAQWRSQRGLGRHTGSLDDNARRAAWVL